MHSRCIDLFVYDLGRLGHFFQGARSKVTSDSRRKVNWKVNCVYQELERSIGVFGCSDIVALCFRPRKRCCVRL